MSFPKKIFVILSCVILISLIFNGFAFAQKPLEVKYPSVPGALKPQSTKTALPDYIRYVFNLSIILVGLIAFGAIVYGGIRYATSVGDPSAMSDAQGQIFSGILGLVLLLSSYLILATINPQLTILAIYKKSTALGVVLTNGQTEQRVGISQPDLEDLNPTHISFLNPGQIEVTVYDAPNYQGNSALITQEGDLPPAGLGQIKSISLNWLEPGVYLYAADRKQQYWTNTNAAELDQFNDKAQEIEFKRGDNNIDFAAILHKDTDFKDECRIFLSDNTNGSVSVSGHDQNGTMGANEVSSVTVFIKGAPDPGSFVRICDQPRYQGNCATYNADNLVQPTNVMPPTYIGDALNDKIRSIQIQGNYLAVLMENAYPSGEWNNDGGTTGKCEVFNQTSIYDLKNDPIGLCSVSLFGLFYYTSRPCTSAIAIYPIAH